MPSIEISGWWVVAIAVSFAWLFLIGRPLNNSLQRRGFELPEPVPYLLAGPIGWYGLIYDQVDTWRRRRKSTWHRIVFVGPLVFAFGKGAWWTWHLSWRSVILGRYAFSVRRRFPWEGDK